MKALGAILGGTIGGVIGAVLWAVVVYYTGYEIIWIALGIGALVGAGVQLGSGRSGGISHGGTAAIIALAAILGGKWAAVRIQVSAYMNDEDAPLSAIADIVVTEREEAGTPVQMPPQEYADSLRETYPRDVWIEAVRRWEALDTQQQETLRRAPPLANPHIWLVWLADEVVEEFDSNGRDVDWPPGMDVDSAWREAHYPADVWAEARTRWDAMSESDREAYKAFVTEVVVAGMAFNEQEIVKQGFLQSFTPFDLLWVGLAVVAAFKLGAAQQFGTAATDGPTA